ncbi:MAG TPA: peptidoglycan-associated lipoprotein Pal [Oligoflexia bacterium]|nr:peptidoglycan-associated lipoprotein Pal [Oligoflexia bacterium]
MFNHRNSGVNLRRAGWLRAVLAGMFVLACLAAPAVAEQSPWTTSLGGGAFFFEGDEDYNPGQMYELRQGYDFSPAWTLEGSFGYGPFFAEKDEPVARNADSQSTKFGLDLLYHLDQDPDRTWDPYLGVNAAAVWYRRERQEISAYWQALMGVTAGVGYKLNDNWALRGDYRAMVAEEGGEFNQSALLLATYRWDLEDAAAGADTKGTIFDDEGRTKLQTVYYAFDSAKLTDTSKQKLRENASALNDAKYADKKVVVEGHCDERGTNEYNMALGQRRANSAFEFLRSLGVSGERMSTVSFGEEKPADPGHNEAAWSKNRRAETVVITK